MKNNQEPIRRPITGEDIEELETIELLFFAYRDFISDPDRILKELGFGRAHHRALYFVSRNPNMTVAELLSILKITKQSLARVLRQLIDSGYIIQSEGQNDRRKRLLFVTEKGKSLVLALSQPQSNRIQNALETLEPEAKRNVLKFLSSMIGAQK